MVLSYILSILTLFASAQTAVGYPKLVAEKGKPLMIQWSETHHGVVVNQYINSPVFTVPFKVHENLCTTSAGQTCQLKMQLTHQAFSVLWYKHPDFKKLGHVISGNGAPLQTSESSFFSDFKSLFPKVTKNLKPTSIECTDYSWIPGKHSPQNPPEQLQVARWESEFMTRNEDTGLVENRTTAGAINVFLQKQKNSNALEIKSMQDMTSEDGLGGQPLSFGDNFSWSMREPSGESCQIAFKPASFSTVIDYIILTNNAPIDTSKSSHYIVGSDESSSTEGGGLLGSLNYWFYIQTGNLK